MLPFSIPMGILLAVLWIDSKLASLVGSEQLPDQALALDLDCVLRCLS